MKTDCISIEEKIKQLIHRRRSIRKYIDKPIDEEICNIILDAGKHAPSGKNRQKWFFLLIQNQDKLNTLRMLVKNAMGDFGGSKKKYITGENIDDIVDFGNDNITIKTGYRISSSNPGFSFMFNAPMLIIVAGSPEIDTVITDCAAAMQNMMLAGFMFDIGSCWLQNLNRLARYRTEVGEYDATESQKKLYDFLVGLGMPFGYMVYAAACFGYFEGSIEDNVRARDFKPDNEVFVKHM